MKTAYFFLLFFNLITSHLFSQQLPNKITEWVNNSLIPIKYVTAENGFEDIKPLDTLIGNARIVELGECTHGSSEIFSMKHRMLEYLVKEKGFTVFSMEANMPEAYALNKYILHGEGDPKELIRNMYFWTWYTQEVLDMVEWMKKYNDTSKVKLMFAGFDMQFPGVPAKIVRDYATLYLPSLLTSINNYDTLYLQNHTLKDFKKSIAKQLQQYANIIIDGFNSLDKSKKDTSFIWALQNAKILLQYAVMAENVKTIGEKRDEAMAENVQWISDQNPDAKMVIWAHNEHIRKATRWIKPMGYYLNEKFGTQMITIGFSTEEGTYTAVKRENEKALLQSGNKLLPSTEDDIEYYFKAAKADNFIVDFRKSEQEASNDWISKKIMMRSIGARVMDKYQFLNIHLDHDFDMIIFLKKTTSSKCFRIL